LTRVAVKVYFQNRIPRFNTFRKAFKWKTFKIFYDHLVYLCTLWPLALFQIGFKCRHFIHIFVSQKFFRGWILNLFFRNYVDYWRYLPYNTGGTMF
jgi:hypothetical protein